MTENKSNNMGYSVVEEDDEEIVRLDFDAGKGYSIEESNFYTKEVITEDKEQVEAPGPLNANVITAGKIEATKNTTNETVSSTPSFQNELQDLLLNTMTSKAIASLIAKNRKMETELEILLSNQRIGDLSSIMEKDLDEVTDKPRRELKACYLGDRVVYEKVPDWAKGYIREYIKNMIHGLSILTEDEI